jgi:hypothetical protein
MGASEICGINNLFERDIDLLLAEEIRVNSDFGRWVMEKFGLTDSLRFPAITTNVSVCEDGSEADVLAIFETVAGSTHRLFVENKIDARLMPEQLER